MKRFFTWLWSKIKTFVKWLWTKTKDLAVWLWKQLKDWRNLVIFIIVCAVVSIEVWGSYLMAIITGNNWWWAVGSACWAFWLGPFTPFLAICIAITLGIRKIIEKIKGKDKKATKAENIAKNETEKE